MKIDLNLLVYKSCKHMSYFPYYCRCFIQLMSKLLNYAYDSIVAATYRKKKYQPHSQNTWRELSWPFLRRMEAIPGFSCRGWIW